jgi:hypothetical protein
MSDIVTIAKKWLSGDKVASSSSESSYHIIDTLLAEIHRVEDLNVTLTQECQRLKCEGVKDITLAVAEECAVICETAEYAVRSYGCAHAIRKKFGLPMK